MPFFDDILIDAPAGIERGFRLAASAAQEAVVVSTPDAVCVRSAAAAVDALYAMDIAPIHLIINRFKAQPVSKRQLLNIDQVIDSAGAVCSALCRMIRMLRTVRRWANQCPLIARRAARIFESQKGSKERKSR